MVPEFLSVLCLPVLVFSLSYRPSTKTPINYVHDSSFEPDRILRISAAIWPLDCTTRYSVLINGSVPGPDLRFREGDQIWIRVYNDQEDANVTIVSSVSSTHFSGAIIEISKHDLFYHLRFCSIGTG